MEEACFYHLQKAVQAQQGCWRMGRSRRSCKSMWLRKTPQSSTGFQRHRPP